MNTFKTFALYIGLKWTLFYIYQFSTSNTKWNFSKANSEGIFLAAFMLLIIPLSELVILYLPFYAALKQRGWIAMLILAGAFGLEFIISWFATNQRYETWMLVKLILSITLFFVIYRKQMSLL